MFCKKGGLKNFAEFIGGEGGGGGGVRPDFGKTCLDCGQVCRVSLLGEQGWLFYSVTQLVKLDRERRAESAAKLLKQEKLHLIPTCSKLIIEILEKGVKYVQNLQ